MQCPVWREVKHERQEKRGALLLLEFRRRVIVTSIPGSTQLHLNNC